MATCKGTNDTRKSPFFLWNRSKVQIKKERIFYRTEVMKISDVRRHNDRRPAF